uniref:TSA: Wollemia nobilis Ref_Wollemi_Transcript_12915_1145 transcribed RNA sequence n=1 Tax=Wollemia nobilis TaxID=56998 RepID=A0A0C9RL14_9CONI
MVEAAKFSLKQNAMPLPPWRALGYLRAKWFSPYKRMDVDTQSKHCTTSFHIGRRSADYCSKPRQCIEQLRRLKAYVLGEVDSGRDSSRGVLKTMGMLSERRLNILKT